MIDRSADSIEFGDLPDSDRGVGRIGGVWVPIYEALQARPGEWARIGTFTTRSGASSTARQLQTGKKVGVPAGMLETATRGTDMWARYIGPTA